MTPSPPLAVGLAGAGPWAEKAYAPMLAAGTETRLVGVWARRPEAARALAQQHGCEAFDSFTALLERCDAVAFAVPPDVQAELGVIAAGAGKHLMLDKPLGLTLAQAEKLVEAIDRAGVVTQLMLTQRFRAGTAAFIEQAHAFDAFGGRYAFLTGAFLDGPYATPWRREQGALHDLGPHAFDLVEAALGPIVELTASGDPRRWVSLTCVHGQGAVSELSLSGSLRLPQTVCRLELYGDSGTLAFDVVANSGETPWPRIRAEFAAAVHTGHSPALDAHRGLELQRLIDRALRGVARG